MPLLTQQDAAVSPFERVPLDKHTIKPDLLDLAGRQRTNPFPWRGQFSPELIEVLLNEYAPATGTVLDPFAGVATTLWESARHGLDTMGTEINPAALTMAESIRFLRLNSMERRATLAAARTWLTELVGDVSAGPLFSGESSAGANGNGCAWQQLAHAITATDDGFKRIVLANTLLRAMESNPADVASGLFPAFDAYAAAVMSLPHSQSTAKIHHADARTCPAPDSTIDLVLTSPPYINVFNYHQNGRTAMEALGWDLLKVARSEFGANRKHRGNRFLTVVQYALDMAEWLAEMRRVLSPSGRMIVIIGRESNVRGVAFRNGELLARLAEMGGGYTLAMRQERRFVTRFGEAIVEDILHFQPGTCVVADAAEARRIAVAALAGAMERQLAGDVASDLRAAIREASTVRSSPLLQPGRMPCPTR